jgi:hypothetical protein
VCQPWTTQTPVPTTSNTGATPAQTAGPGTSRGANLTSCFTQLDACGYPSKTTAGVPAGTALTKYNGPSTITAPNTVIDGKMLGCITVRAPGVVIRNSTLTGSCFWVVDVEDGGSVTVDHSVIDCVDYGGTGIGESHFTVERSQILRCENGADVSWGHITIRDSYIGDVREVNGGHGDGLQISGDTLDFVDVNIEHNTFDMLRPVTSNFEFDSAPTAHLSVENNLLSAGAYTVYCPAPTGAGSVVFAGNRFAVDGKHAPSYGFSTGCGRSGITWSDNYRDDTLAAVRAE